MWVLGGRAAHATGPASIVWHAPWRFSNALGLLLCLFTNITEKNHLWLDCSLFNHSFLSEPLPPLLRPVIARQLRQERAQSNC